MAKRKYKSDEINWAEIESEYITSGDPAVSYRTLAVKYNIPQSTVNRYGTKNNWANKRTEYKHSVINSTLSRARAREASKLAKVMLSVDMLSETIEKVFQDSKQFYRHVMRDPEGGQTETILEKADTRAIRDITASLRDLSCVIRNVYNIPTLQEQQAHEIAVQRLEMERAKTALNTSDEDSGVIIIAQSEAQ